MDADTIPYISPRVENPDGFPSDEDLAALPDDAQVEKLVEWFYHNFEDPANQTPRMDNEFFYLWGGPYDADDYLQNNFSEVVEESIIEKAVRKVESDGIINWAPAHPEYFDDEPDHFDSTEQNQSDFVDRAHDTLDELETAAKRLDALRRSGGVGHNNPPELIDEIPYGLGDEGKLFFSTGRIREVMSSDNISPGDLAEPRDNLSEIRDKILKWLAEKANKVVDAFADTLGRGLAVMLLISIAKGIEKLLALLSNFPF